MTTKEELRQELTLLKANILNFETKLDEFEKQQYGRWKPSNGEVYFYIADYNGVQRSHWDDDDYDLFRWSVGNVYKTEEQAERALERMKIRTQLEDIALRLNKGINIDWNDVQQEKYFLFYDNEEHILTQDYKTISQSDDVYCVEPFLEVARKEIGEERLAKYLKEE